MLSYIFFCFVLASATSGRIRHLTTKATCPSSRVVNGNDASPGEIPYQVSLQSNNRHFCGGSLIATNFVMTAAHCTVAGKVSIALGVLDSRNPEQLLPMKKFHSHPQHDVIPFDHDFAIIELGEPACFGERIGIVKLVSQDKEYAAGTNGFISGWGYSSEFDGIVTPTVPFILQKANIPLVSQSNCQKVWGDRILITEYMQCVGGNGLVSSCMGDSGGPLTVVDDGETVLIGVSSWVEDCCNPDYPAGYAKISKVLPWIYSIIDN